MERVIIQFFIDGYYIWGQVDEDTNELSSGAVTCCPTNNISLSEIEDCEFDCRRCPYTDHYMEQKILDDYEEKLYKIAKYAKEILNL